MENQMKIQNSIDFIEKNLCEEINLDNLARHAYISKFHFHRLFHRFTGEAVMQYIRKRRLAEAARELNHTHETITDIALKYQFGSQESFSRAFKKMYGISPKEYRHNNLAIISNNKANLWNEKSSVNMSVLSTRAA